MPLIDFHCHLADCGGYSALPAAASLFVGTTPVVSVTNRPGDWSGMARPVRPGVAWGLGLHPELQHSAPEVAEFLRQLPACDVVGEVGLDYGSRSKASRHSQRATLDVVLGAAPTASRLVSIHSRGATRDVLSALTDHQVPGAVLHWFLGSDEDVERAIDLDAYFSVNDAMLHSERGRRVVGLLPPNRVILETDAPYGGYRKKNRPGDLTTVVGQLATRWARPATAVAALIERNQERLLSRVRTPAALKTTS